VRLSEGLAVSRVAATLRGPPIRKASFDLTPSPTLRQQRHDEGKITMMFNYQNFDEVFGFDPDCSYDDDAVAEIEANRKHLEGLFIEKVMKLLGIKRRELSLLTTCRTPC
jgi:hypothetical protein